MERSGTSVEIIETPLTGPGVWDANSVIPDGGVIELTAASRRELTDVAEVLRRNPLPTTLLDQRRFRLDACRRECESIRNVLDSEVGFAIIERLPVEEYDYDVTVGLYWLLMSMIGRPVAQKYDGEMIYDVTDTGRKPTAGSGVRSSKSNWGQPYHTDNAFNVPPAYVGLLCIRPAETGGESGLVSCDRVYNELLARYPQHVGRLYEPFWFDRQREHATDEALCSFVPVFESNNSVLHIRLANNIIRHGYEVQGVEIDEPGRAALEALDTVLEGSDMGRTFDFSPGQIQIVNNTRVGHRRTAFVDSANPALKRHLVRIWLRETGEQFYAG